MPRGATEHRANQSALLAGLKHEKATDPRIGELLSVLEDSALVEDRESPEAVNVREPRRVYDRLVRQPRRLVEEIARITCIAQQEWTAARQQGDFARFRPWLTNIVGLKRRQAESLGNHTTAYDALLEEYEPGATSREIAQLLGDLQLDLIPLVNAIAGARRKPNVTILERRLPIDRRRSFIEAMAAAIGFDFERGRIDVAEQSCISIGPGDCRITLRYSLDNFSHNFFSILHEVGHGLYEQGLDPEYYGTPMGEAVSVGVHESQARLWENMIGRSRAFWEYFFPLAQQTFCGAFDDMSRADFHFAVNNVEASVIRVRADEVTYDMHILARFELEKALLNGDLNASDVPLAWNDAYRKNLGITPKNDAEGCLQDAHWSVGLFGYFPTYTLGNVFSAQLFARTTEELGDLREQFARGEFLNLLNWLREKVYRQGSRYSASQLIERVCGSPPNHQALLMALKRKYSELYGF